MRIAVVHNLRSGGAARRLSGTLKALTAHPDLIIREFTLSTAIDLGYRPNGAADEAGSPAGLARVEPASRVAFKSAADTAARWLRPPMRYADLLRLRAAWRETATRVNNWRPDAVFASPCGISNAAPSALQRIAAPILYYCDEPRRADYEPAARASTNAATRPLYGPLRAAMRHDDRAAIKAARLLATNSAYSAAGIRAAYNRHAEVVPPGIAGVFTPAARPVQVRHILSVGTLIPSKGHDLVVSAVGRAGVDLPVLVVAPRPNPTEERRLQDLAAKVGVRLQIKVAVSDSELAELYRSAFVTLYLARAEPLGLASLESQACGTPVIVADEGGLGGTVVDSVTGYRVRRQAEAVAERLAKLGRGALRDQLAEQCARTPPLRDADAAQTVLRLLGGIASTDGEHRPVGRASRERVA